MSEKAYKEQREALYDVFRRSLEYVLEAHLRFDTPYSQAITDEVFDEMRKRGYSDAE